MMDRQRTRQWFRDRIGKRIYRSPITTCPCSVCQKEYVDIWDGVRDGKQEQRREFHADYIHLCHNELAIDYFDTLEEARASSEMWQRWQNGV